MHLSPQKRSTRKACGKVRSGTANQALETLALSLGGGSEARQVFDLFGIGDTRGAFRVLFSKDR
jgi:hypothetical protein